MRDLGLVGDVIGPELDAMLDAAALDERHLHRIVIDAVYVLSLAVKYATHGENGLERVALGAAGRRHVSFAARDPDRVVEDGLDGFGFDPAAVVPDRGRPIA